MSRRDGRRMESLRGIGQMSRESGLTVSALRFYDGAGVLAPARVDPQTGYRFYAPDQLVVARLVATLRRVGMPLAGIRTVLAHRHDATAVDGLLAEHLRRLEKGLVDARRELSSVRSLLDEETSMTTTITLSGAELADALRAVRFAVGSDPEPPVLGGVLFDVTAKSVTLVATDRYRLAVASAPVRALDGPAAAAVVPVELADRIPAAGTVEISLDGATITVRCGADVLRGTLIPDDFPDYRRVLSDGGRPVAVAPALRAAVAAGPSRTMRREQDGTEFEVAVLREGVDGLVVVDVESDSDPGGGSDGDIGVNREFLLEALDAGGDGQLQLSLDGPIAPLVVRSARSVSMLMPVRL